MRKVKLAQLLIAICAASVLLVAAFEVRAPQEPAAAPQAAALAAAVQPGR